MKKLACLLLDEEVRGGALSEENSKRFHVHCKKKKDLFLFACQRHLYSRTLVCRG